MLYLNPPYHDDAGEEKRTEHAFLRHCTRYLAEHGLLVFVVPRRRPAVSANYLASHYARLRCWAFPEPEREAFDQLVVTGTRKAEVQYHRYSAMRPQESMAGNVEELTKQRYWTGVPTAPWSVPTCRKRTETVPRSSGPRASTFPVRSHRRPPRTHWHCRAATSRPRSPEDIV